MKARTAYRQDGEGVSLPYVVVTRRERRRISRALRRLNQKAHLTGHTVVVDSAGGQLDG